MTLRVEGLLCACLLTAMAAAGCDSSQAANPVPPDAAPAKSAPAAQEPAPAPQKPAPAPEKAAKPSTPSADAPLLLTSNAPVITIAPKPGYHLARNDRCHVCHMNFGEEKLSVQHAQVAVGCERCHGPSDDHCGDEGNVTAPSIMFPREKIDRACKECHPDPAERIVMGARYCLHIPEGPEVGKTCTECHGAHRMAVRTVRWDPTTGKPLDGNAQ